jgi:hypothetical protein
MNMQRMVAVVLVSGLAVGCGSTSTSQAPTHRWASNGGANEIQYRGDHARCQADAQIEADAVALNSNSPEFERYKQCMKDSGYELMAYSN